MGAGGEGSRPSPPQRAVTRNVLTNPYLWGKGNRGGDDGGVRVGVVGVIRVAVVKVVKVEGNIDSGRLLAGTVFY